MASLNRSQWEEMWYRCKEIEKNVAALKNINKLRGQAILANVKAIKSFIQEVIGQME